MNSCCRTNLDQHKAIHRRCPPGCVFTCSCNIEWINDSGAWCKSFTLSRRHYNTLRGSLRVRELMHPR